ncbi:UNVERIFIED_CONTAM: hypothetical protein Slati_0941800 [Sesamum latifolium]|uniref:Uncharacterized protein n=1 Tax=Sesamum latifolium TaxID=2727402 RepID=A0AAW2XUL6_9LAMI
MTRHPPRDIHISRLVTRHPSRGTHISCQLCLERVLTLAGILQQHEQKDSPCQTKSPPR